MKVFIYGQTEIDYLKKKCPALGKCVDEIGVLEREVIPNLYAALVNSIVGQQISTKAWVTIWNRIQDRFGEITAENMIRYSCETIQSVGISMKKAQYIREAAEKVTTGELNLEELHELPDDEICKRLSVLKGIGVWTAEMLLIFSMQRKDVFSFDDIAIHRGLRMLYKHRKITKELFEKYRRKYSPYASIASLYLWALADGACGLKDYAPMTEAKKKMLRRQRAHAKKRKHKINNENDE